MCLYTTHLSSVKTSRESWKELKMKSEIIAYEWRQEKTCEPYFVAEGIISSHAMVIKYSGG